MHWLVQVMLFFPDSAAAGAGLYVHKPDVQNEWDDIASGFGISSVGAIKLPIITL